MYKHGHNYVDIIAVDTERCRGKVWSVQLADFMSPKKAHVVLMDEPKRLPTWKQCLEDPETLTVMHNALYDLCSLRMVGINPANVIDTMVLAYLLEYDSLGLKTLAYRELGLELREYSDVVKGSGLMRQMEYFTEILNRTWEAPLPILEVKGDGSHTVKYPQPIEKKVNRLMNDIVAGKAVDVETRWDKMDGREQVEDVLGELPVGELCDVPLDEAVWYAGMDATATAMLYQVLMDKYHARFGDDCPLCEIDMGIIPMLDYMMQEGVALDMGKFSELEQYVTETLIDKEEELGEMAGKYVNPRSSIQVKQLLNDVFGLGVQDTSAASMDVHKKNPVVKSIQECREYHKLLHTYVSKLPRMVDANGRLHTELLMTRTGSGRLASKNPNLQNIPTRTEVGRRVRNGFVAGAANLLLLSADYSQIEMRIAAHLSGDALMCGMFRNGEDVHTMTASRMFKVDPKDVDAKTQRYPAKRTGFGILYGITAEGLLDVFYHDGVRAFTLRDCQGFIDSWFETFSGVADYIQEVTGFIRRLGYAETMYHRRRTMVNAWSSLEYVRDAAIREGVNMPIQGSAADIIKVAMMDLTPIYKRVQELGIRCAPLLQIHDELLWEVEEEFVPILADTIKDVMESAVKLSVPTKVDVEVGTSWGGLKALEEWYEN